MADEETSLREDLESAIGAADDAPEEPNEVEAAPTQETAQEAPQEVPAETADDTPEPEPEAPPAYKPPVDWAPEVKSQFAELAPEVQQAIADRERGINDTLQETAQIRDEYSSFNQMIQPFLPMMHAEGVTDPTTAIHGLLQTTAALQMGSQAQKAERIAQLINHYQIDIEMLDNVLSGQMPADPGEARLEQLLNQRMAPVNQLLERVNQSEHQQQEQAAQSAYTDIHAFGADPKNLHFDSVRNIMADFLDMAAQQGQVMTLEDAYQRACLSDPNIAPLVTQQHAQNAAADHQGMIAGKRNAASSISGRPTPGKTSELSDDMSLRETIEAQFGAGGRI